MRKQGGISADFTDKKILVVEDNHNLLPFFEFILNESGFQVVPAANGQEGLLKFEEYGEAIGMVVTDLKMPLMDGLELRRRLHEVSPNLPVIAVSAYTDTTEFSEQVINRFTAVLLKPFTPDDLLKSIHTIMEAAPQN